MEEKDFRRIEEMMYNLMGRFRGEVDQSFDQRFTQFLGEVDQSFDQRFIRFRGDVGEVFRHQLGVQGEDFQHKLDLVVEGQQMLADKLETTRSELKTEIGKVYQRVTAVAADLSAHRRDTEAHRKGWRVREEEGGE